jgi:hypothetical protein
LSAAPFRQDRRGKTDFLPYSAGAFTGKFSQVIIDNVRLTEGNDSGISLTWRIAPFGEVLAGFDTRLDTPPHTVITQFPV